jgi:hypothetical protein
MGAKGESMDFRSTFKYPVVIAILVYLILGLLLWSTHKYQITPDGTAYIQIAQHYADGDYTSAINGFWGVLLSWLLIPFLALGIPGFLAAKLVNVMLGAFTLLGCTRIFTTFNFSNIVRWGLLATCIPMILYFVYSVVTPDLLLLCILVIYLGLTLNPNFGMKRRHGPLYGLTGGLMYLAKAYGFYFFLLHFPIVTGLHYLHARSGGTRKSILQTLALGMIAFFVISGAWISVISTQQGKFTISSAGEYNFKLQHPKFANWRSMQHPVLHNGFVTPPRNALSIWDRPDRIEMEAWRLTSWPDLAHKLYLSARRTARLYFIIYPQFSILVLPILLLAAAYALFYLRKGAYTHPLVLTLLLVVLYPVGYLIMHVLHRYVWLNQISILIMGVFLAKEIGGKYRWGKTVTAFTLIVVMGSFVVYPAYTLEHNKNYGRTEYDYGQALIKKEISGRLASNQNWSRSLIVAYHLRERDDKTSYFGVAKAGMNDQDLLSELKQLEIEYYLVWDESEREKTLFAGFVRIDIGGTWNLVVYRCVF